MFETTASLPGCPCVRLLGTVGAVEASLGVGDLRGMEGLGSGLLVAKPEFSYLPELTHLV